MTRFHIKDLAHFYPVDPFFRKTVIVDRQFHTSVMDLANFCPIVPFYGDGRDAQLGELARLLASLSKSDDVKADFATLFDILKALRCDSIDGTVKYLF